MAKLGIETVRDHEEKTFFPSPYPFTYESAMEVVEPYRKFNVSYGNVLGIRFMLEPGDEVPCAGSFMEGMRIGDSIYRSSLQAKGMAVFHSMRAMEVTLSKVEGSIDLDTEKKTIKIRNLSATFVPKNPSRMVSRQMFSGSHVLGESEELSERFYSYFGMGNPEHENGSLTKLYTRDREKAEKFYDSVYGEFEQRRDILKSMLKATDFPTAEDIPNIESRYIYWRRPYAAAKGSLMHRTDGTFAEIILVVPAKQGEAAYFEIKEKLSVSSSSGLYYKYTSLEDVPQEYIKEAKKLFGSLPELMERAKGFAQSLED